MADFHSEELQKYCRVCGKRLSRFRVKYKCEKRSEDLAQTFGLRIADDDPAIHPLEFCHGCYNVMMRARRARDTDRFYTPCVELFKWRAHESDSDPCGICEYFKATSSGGRPKQCKVGRPPAISVKSTVSYLFSEAPPSFFPSPDGNSGQYSHLTGSTVQHDDFHCHLCTKVVDRPIHLTTCNKLVCMDCLCRALEEARECRCPCCDGDHIQDYTTMVQPPPALLRVLGTCQVHCNLCGFNIAAGTVQ